MKFRCELCGNWYRYTEQHGVELFWQDKRIGLQVSDWAAVCGRCLSKYRVETPPEESRITCPCCYESRPLYPHQGELLCSECIYHCRGGEA